VVSTPAGFTVPIPSGYDHLEFMLIGRGTVTQDSAGVLLTINNDATSAHYRRMRLTGASGAASSASASGNVLGEVVCDSGDAGQFDVLHGFVYAISDTGRYTTVRTFDSLTHEAVSGDGLGDELRSLVWLNTAAVTQIQFAVDATPGTFEAGTRLVVVGVKDQAVVTDVAGGGAQTVEAAFTYATSSPLALTSVTADVMVLEVQIEITTAFDGAPALTVGEAGATARLMAAGENLPGEVGIYKTAPVYVYAGAADIRLYLSAGGATQGAGRVIVSLVAGV
jgi:hypothetical protein